jgi:hypothetical protein
MYFVYVGNAAAPATISAALNNGDGTFAAAVPVSYTPQQNGGYPGFTLLPLGSGGNTPSSASKSNATPAGTYKFQVIATAGTAQATTDCTLIVQ